MKSWARRHATILIFAIVLLAGIATHFAYYSRQQTTVFDEVYFGTYAQDYFSHSYYFDPHPPLGKMLLAASTLPGGVPLKAQFVATPYKGVQPNFARLRLLPALASIGLALVMVGVALKLGMSRWAAGLVGLCVDFDNALVTQGRFVLIDSFLLFFGFSSLLCYLQYRHSKQWPWLLASGALAALSFSIKWTGVVFICLIGLLYVGELVKKYSAMRLLLGIVSFLIIPFAIYFGTFAVHFALLTKTGQGDAFMSDAFVHNLAGSRSASNSNIKGLNTWQKFVELNKVMNSVEDNLTATHPYGSPWYSWPLMHRDIYYYYDNNQYVYLLGNPLIWWGGALAVVVLVCLVAAYRKMWTFRNRLLLTGFFASWLPFLLIHRVMFLYHYLVALIFSILIAVSLLDSLKHKRQILGGLLVGIVALFLFFAPLTYGLPLSSDGLQARMWLSSWR